MKRCGICNLKKPESEFYRNAAKRDGLQSKCKDCNAKYVRSHYERHRDYYKLKAKKNRHAQTSINKQAVQAYLKDHPCVDCGESDPIVLEFDHVHGEKEMHVSRMANVGISLQRVMAEIAKCEVRCANCHRRKTAKQFGWQDSPSSERPTTV